MRKFRRHLKTILIITLVVLIILCIIFWGSVFSGCVVTGLVLGFPVFLFNRVADNDYKEEFDRGKNVEGWQ